MNENVYIHEYIDIILQGRPKYFEHMTKGWAEGFGPERPMKCFAVWGTLGSTARWPECINIWELPGWKGMAKNFAIEVNHPSMQDPKLKIWWDEAQKYRSGGFDRLLIPAGYSPTVDEFCKNPNVVGAQVFYHERIQIQPGQAKTYLSMMEQEWLPVANKLGMHLVGAFRTAMRNESECIVVWAIPKWEGWADVEIAYENDARVATWRRRTQGLAIDWLSHLMVSAPLSPTKTGKQP
jgi:hypothetical protein